MYVSKGDILMKLKDVSSLLVGDVEILYMWRNVFGNIFDYGVDCYNLNDTAHFADCMSKYGDRIVNSLCGDDGSIFITVIWKVKSFVL